MADHISPMADSYGTSAYLILPLAQVQEIAVNITAVLSIALVVIGISI
jgi:hypothetical protein